MRCDGQAYNLWKVDNPDWAIIPDARNPNGIETGGLWLGGPKTEFLTVAATGGPPSPPSSSPGRPEPVGFIPSWKILPVATKIVLQSSENRFPFDLAPGRGSFALTIEDPTSGPVPDHGDTRPLILHLTDYSIERGGKGQP